ncbi:MAG: thiosulfate/3-mercaptopyruvate sulfurtransferase [Chloroflexi bacterium]|nr:MAG: thiosulfate/3-mercaptopyruvate sulfurtransferase [Chloroflexota bacterium]
MTEAQTAGLGWARPELLAETEWLAAHLEDAGLVVVDCDLLPAYQRLHIPGAVWSQSRYWKAEDLEQGLHAIADAEQFASIMGRLGISNASRVVAYDGSGGLYAERFWWTCRRFGFEAVQVLDGGMDKWQAEGRPLSRVNERPTAASFRAMGPDDSTVCRLDDVRGDCESDGHVFWDVRSDGEWSGANRRGTKNGGRVPNAVHLEWQETLESPVRRLKSPSALRRLLSEHGITPEKTVTTY